MHQPQGSGLRASPAVSLMALAAFAAALRFILLDDKNLWLDEAASWWTSRFDVAGLLAAARDDIHPPLYYLLLKSWTSIVGDGLFAMRSLSVCFGTIVVVITTMLARRWLPASIALMTAIWIAVAPHAVYYAQEARMYAAVSAVLAGAVLAYLRWLDTSSRRPLAVLAVLVAAAMYLHYFSALFVIALSMHFAWWTLARRGGPAAEWEDRGRRWRDWIVAHGVSLLLYTPWLSAAFGHVSRGQPWRADVAMSQLPFELYMALRHVLQGYTYPGTVAMFVVELILLSLAGLGLVLLGIHGVRRGPRDAAGLLAVIIGVPAAAGLAALGAVGHMDLSRYLGYLTPFVIVGSALGWSRTLGARARMPLAILVGCSAVWLLAHYRVHSRDSDVRPIVEILRATPGQPQPGPVLIAPGFMRICLDYYLRDTGAPSWIALNAGDDLRQQLDIHAPAHAIVDYRWPEGFRVATDAGFVEVPVTSAGNGIKLFQRNHRRERRPRRRAGVRTP